MQHDLLLIYKLNMVYNGHMINHNELEILINNCVDNEENYENLENDTMILMIRMCMYDLIAYMERYIYLANDLNIDLMSELHKYMSKEMMNIVIKYNSIKNGTIAQMVFDDSIDAVNVFIETGAKIDSEYITLSQSVEMFILLKKYCSTEYLTKKCSGDEFIRIGTYSHKFPELLKHMMNEGYLTDTFNLICHLCQIHLMYSNSVIKKQKLYSNMCFTCVTILSSKYISQM